MADWDRSFALVEEKDPYHHCGRYITAAQYDHSKPWVTHVSLQRLGFRERCSCGPLPQTTDLRRVQVRRRHSAPLAISRTGNGAAFLAGHGSGAYWATERLTSTPTTFCGGRRALLHGESPRRIAFLRPDTRRRPRGSLNNPCDLLSGARAGGPYYLFLFRRKPARE